MRWLTNDNTLKDQYKSMKKHKLMYQKSLNIKSKDVVKVTLSKFDK